MSGCWDGGSGVMPGMDANADARFPGYRLPAVMITDGRL